MTSEALLGGRDLDAIVARRDGAPITGRRYIADASALARSTLR